MLDPVDISQKIRNFVRFKLVEGGEDDPTNGGQFPVDRQVVSALAIAWADAVRDEWQNWIKANPLLQDAYAVALVLMREDGYTESLGDPVVGWPGYEPCVANVDGRKCVCYEQAMINATPLSAIYVNKVKTVVDAVEKVEAEKAKAAAAAPAEGLTHFQ